MNTIIQRSTIVTMLAVLVSTASQAAAQCPDSLPPSLVSSVRNSDVRAAAQGFRINAALIAQSGGLPTMISQLKGQIAADQATANEERGNQTYLAQNGMGSSKRAADGRLVIEMMEDSHRLNTAMLQILECHARGTSAGIAAGPTGLSVASPGRESFTSAGSRESIISPSSHGGRRTGGPGTVNGADIGEAIQDLSRTLRDRALVNADPEVAAFYAKQDARQAENEANMAAMNAAHSRGLIDARRDSVDEQMKMVSGVVRGWRAPAGYARTGAVNASAIQDPFAAEAKIDAVKAAIGTSGLTWDRGRGLARVGDPRGACGGRLQAGDYPVLLDGTLLDAPEQISKFLSVCGDPAFPLLVVRENGNVEVRK